MKKYTNKVISFLLVVTTMFGFMFGNATTAEAKLNDSLFWGITANFESGGFEGFVVTDDNGYFDEAWHSFAYKKLTTADSKLGLNSASLQGTSEEGITYYIVY